MTWLGNVIHQVAFNARGPLMNIRYRVELIQEERDQLTVLAYTDLLGRSRGLLCQARHFGCNHGKALAGNDT